MKVTETGSRYGGTDRRRLSEFGRVVDRKVTALQERFCRSRPDAGVVADLARLRRGAGKDAGEIPELWHLTLGELPQPPAGTGDGPTREERAVHLALTLYGLHQQSMRQRMHAPGYSVGRSARLCGHKFNPEAVHRRFVALGTASSFMEAAHHLRGLVQQMRAAEVPLDYGRLADDLVGLQIPERAQSVLLTWGRDFHRTQPTTTSAGPDGVADVDYRTGDGR